MEEEDRKLRLILEETSGKTIPTLFLKRVKELPKGIAFRYKDLGIYKEVTWEKFWKEVEDFAFGLLELGLEPGDRVAIMGDPCPEWIYADLAVLCAKGVDYGVYTTSSIEEIEYLMQTGGAKFFIAENQEYVDKILLIAGRLPRLSRIIVIDTRAIFMYEDARLISFSEVQELGRQRKGKFPEQISQNIQQGDPDGPAFLIFTSGTAGPPKPAVLSHKNVLLGFVYPLGEIFPDLLIHEQRGVSHLSMAHIVERGISLYMPLVYNFVPHIGESLEFLQETLYEVQPTFLHGVPRVWEKIAGQALVGIESSSWIKKSVYRWAMKQGQSYLMKRWEDQNTPFTSRLLYWIAVNVAFRHILHRLGLPKVKSAYAAGAPLPTSIQILWQTWGVDLVNLYGATESGGTITSERPGFGKPGTVGKPTSINAVRLAEDGEVMVAGPGVFLGYWNDERTTREAIKDGWLHMGDIGEYTEKGKLKLIDRKKDIMITSGGKNISPSLIETTLKASPYISEAVLIADGRKYPTALIEIDFETVSEWARRNELLYTGFTSLATHPKTYDLIAEEVMRCNEKFARVERVKRFRIIPKELDPGVGTTATRKIKRREIYKIFQDLIEEMYMSKEEFVLTPKGDL